MLSLRAPLRRSGLGRLGHYIRVSGVENTVLENGNVQTERDATGRGVDEH